MLNVSPDPNASSTTQDNNFVAAPIDRNRTNQFDIRVDHQFSQSLNMFGRYSFSKTNFFRPGTRPGLSEGSSNDTFGTADLKSQALAAGLVWVAAPALVSETHFGYGGRPSATLSCARARCFNPHPGEGTTSAASRLVSRKFGCGKNDTSCARFQTGAR